jgi:cyclic pyranopterin phosphate synthase
MNERLTHLDRAGRARMVDVGDKARHGARSIAQRPHPHAGADLGARHERRSAERAMSARSPRSPASWQAKRTSDLIPLCHPDRVSSLKVDVAPMTMPCLGFVVTARARTTGQTGVEMEALTAVSVACLTLYDMLKAIDRGMVIEAIA